MRTLLSRFLIIKKQMVTGIFTFIILGVVVLLSEIVSPSAEIFEDLSLLSIVILFISIIIAIILGFFVMFLIYHFVAKFILGGQATGAQYFRALSNSFVLLWFVFIPYISILLFFYLFNVVNIFILHKVHKMSLIKSIIAALSLEIFGVILVITGVLDISQFL